MSAIGHGPAVPSCSPQVSLQYAVQRCPMAVLLQRRGAMGTRLSARPASRFAQSSPLHALSTPGLIVDIQPEMNVATAAPDPQPTCIAAELAPAPAAQAIDFPLETTEVAAQQPQEATAPQHDRKKLWMAAIKPPMYSVGFIPVLVAAAAAFWAHGVLPWGRTAGFVLAAILVIAWLNLSNDAFDAHTGVDATKPESVVNLLGGGASRRTAVLLLSKSLLAAGVALLGHLITSAPGGDLRPAALLAFSIACGYVYQGPPFRLSYKGLGEPLCFFAFGPSATTAFYLALQPTAAAAVAAPAAAAAAAGLGNVASGTGGMAGVSAAAAAANAVASLVSDVPPVTWSCSLLVGLTTTVILFCSHFHQIAGDTAAGKRSPLVRLGTERGRKVLRSAAIAAHAAALLAAAVGVLPWPAAAATVLVAPLARELVAFADANHTVPERIAPLKRYAVKWHIGFGMCLCAGLATARALGL